MCCRDPTSRRWVQASGNRRFTERKSPAVSRQCCRLSTFRPWRRGGNASVGCGASPCDSQGLEAPPAIVFHRGARRECGEVAETRMGRRSGLPLQATNAAWPKSVGAATLPAGKALVGLCARVCTPYVDRCDSAGTRACKSARGGLSNPAGRFASQPRSFQDGGRTIGPAIEGHTLRQGAFLGRGRNSSLMGTSGKGSRRRRALAR